MATSSTVVDIKVIDTDAPSYRNHTPEFDHIKITFTPTCTS